MGLIARFKRWILIRRYVRVLQSIDPEVLCASMLGNSWPTEEELEKEIRNLNGEGFPHDSDF